MAYTDTLIVPAEDSNQESSAIPETKRDKKPMHIIQYELLINKPYFYDHKNLIFEANLIKDQLSIFAEVERIAFWDKLFSKGHPCMRASALTKKWGYAAHYNSEGKIALIPIESKEYEELQRNHSIKKIMAMRSSRK